MARTSHRTTRRMTIECLEPRHMMSLPGPLPGPRDFGALAFVSGEPWLLPNYTMVGMPFHFSVDPGLGAQYPLLQANLEAAGKILTGLLGGKGSIEVEVVLSTNTTYDTANGGSDYVYDTATDASGATFQLAIPATLYEAQTGIDKNGSQPDIHIEISPNYLAKVWFDPSGVQRTAPMPADKVDFISIALHEMLHGLGMEGFRSTGAADYGKFTMDTKSTYDVLTELQGLGTWYFVGTQATKAYGEAVPLMSQRGYYAAAAFYHVGDMFVGKDLHDDLMSGMGSSKGVRYDVSAVDRAILADLGWQGPRWVKNILIPQKPFLRAKPPIGPNPPIYSDAALMVHQPASNPSPIVYQPISRFESPNTSLGDALDAMHARSFNRYQQGVDAMMARLPGFFEW